MATRRERVLLEVEDRASKELLKAAAAARLLEGALDGIDGTSVRTNANLRTTSRQVDGLSQSAVRGASSIDRYSGRLRLMSEAALLLGPALVPIGAVAIPAVAGLAAQLGFAAGGVATMVVAFQGVGDALEAVNKAALEPTTENMIAARQAMQDLAPEAQRFVRELDGMRDSFTAVRDSAAAGLFPGMTQALGELDTVLPRVGDIFERIGEVAGDLTADAAGWFNSGQGQEFLTFIEQNAPQALEELGRTVGNFTRGLAELWMAFDPLNDDFSAWLLDASRSFATWADGLSRTQGFKDFVAYIRENGPVVAEAAGAIGNALVQIVKAAAPLGGPTLKAITAVADAVAAIAGSDAGTPLLAMAAGMLAVARAAKIMQGALAASGAMSLLGLGGPAGRAGASRAGLANPIGLAGTAILAGVLHAWDNAKDTIEGDQSPGAALIRALIPGAGISDSLFGTDFTSQIEKSFQGRPLEIPVKPKLDLSDPDVSNPFKSIDPGDLGTGPNFGGATAQAKALREALSQIGGAKTGASLGAAEAGLRALGNAAGVAASGLNTVDEALAGLSGWLDRRAALRGYRDALRGLGKTLDGTFSRQDKENIDAVGQGILQVANTIKRPAGRAAFVDKAIAGLRKLRGEASAAEKKEIDALLGKLRHLSATTATPSIKLGGAAAAGAAIGGVGAALANLNGRTATTYIRTVRLGASLGGLGAGAGAAADGTTVPRSGRGYADRYPYLLADGEEVISNRYGQADRHRALLKAINANRLADGGTAHRVGSRGGSSALRHDIYVHVSGEMDWERAKGEIRGEVAAISGAVADSEAAANARWGRNNVRGRRG